MVAARFPVKSDVVLLTFVIVAHIGVVAGSSWLINQWWMITVIVLTSLLSLFISIRHYRAITRANDDLCWSGETWLMHCQLVSESNGVNKGQVCYLDLLPTSWLTPNFCLLKFQQDESEKAWFFSRRSLGERLYRELCYLVRLNMKDIAMNKNNI